VFLYIKKENKIMQIMPINNYNNYNRHNNKITFKHLLADSTFKQSPLLNKVLSSREIQKFVKNFNNDFDVYASAFRNKDNKQVIRLMLFRNGILSGHHIDLEEDMIDKFRMTYPYPKTMLYSPNEIKQVPKLTEEPAADEEIKKFNYKLDNNTKGILRKK
jgi:hypothetical protein